jgi:hypothetical protein
VSGLPFELGATQVVGYTAVAVVVVAWLLTSLLRGEPARLRTAWVGATGLFVALASLFAHLFARAREGESLAGTIAFGFLLVIFVSGCAVSAVKTVGAFRSRAAGDAHATH